MSANDQTASDSPPAAADDVRRARASCVTTRCPASESSPPACTACGAAGAPPSTTWLGRVAESARDLARLRGDRPQKRSLFTGAVLRLVTASPHLLAGPAGREALREPAPRRRPWASPRRPARAEALDREHKGHTAGDRHLTRDRMGENGAERPERARARQA
jgi:hypothetical protein